MRIKVFFFIDSFRIGGMHRQILYLLKHLNKEEFELVLCTTGSEGGLKEQFEQTGCKLVNLGWNKRVEPAIIFRFIKILEAEKPNIIFINAPQNLLYYLTARLFWRKPVVQIGSFRAMNFWLGHLKKSYQRIDNFLAGLMVSTSNYVIVNSIAMKEQYTKVININPRKPIEVIYNGSDFDFKISRSASEIREELGITSKEIMIVMVARLDPWKDFVTLLGAAKIVSSSDPRAKFVLVGDGELRDEINHMVEQMDLRKNVLMVGEKKNSFDYINASDISVLSTNGEGFSNSIMESMAFGKPVIATAVGGNPELLGTEEEFGFVIPPKSPVMFASKILILMKDENMRRRVGESANKRIHGLCEINAYTSAYEDLFRRSINK
jgi:glycosyltransferase involved in cell wall biosynthesis